MVKRPLLRSITAILSALGVNAVPAIGFFGLGWSWETTLVLYLLETVLGIPFVALRIRLLSPAQEDVIGASLPDSWTTHNKKSGAKVIRYAWPTADGVRYERAGLLQSYLLVVVSFSAVLSVFILVFLFLIMQVQLDWAAFRSGLLGILIFQLVGFLADLVWLRPLSLAQAEKLGEQSMGRAALLYVAVFAGLCAASFHPYGFLLPFIGLKTMVDVGQPIQAMWNYRRRAGSTLG
ncbi:MAG: hypothetical protein H6632_13425 [Anaerolineales bacterium]|nr:hypothetical protein [Anaerolineales bacterium]